MEFKAVLNELRATAKSTAEQGRLFEKLMLAVLPQLPDHNFEGIWLWSDWPDRQALTGLDARDLGIDLVAKRPDEDGFCAIQCKFFDLGSTLTEGDLGTFFALSGNAAFSSKLIVTTTNSITKNAQTVIRSQEKPTNILDFFSLRGHDIDWNLANPLKTKVNRTPAVLRDYQRDALERVAQGFVRHDRGKLIMACGTGKTLTALHIAESLTPDSGNVLFLVPSISLLSQTMHEWACNGTKAHRYVAVCSDTKVDRRSEDISVEDLAIPATTNAHNIASVLKRKANSLTITFSTYQSLDRIHQAQMMGAPGFDIVICDEAHRTTGIDRTGMTDRENSPFTRIHDPEYVKAVRRLYMTATPRIYTESAKAKAEANDIGVFSMDDEATYGPEFFRLDFSTAINDNHLTDYRVVVLTVHEDQLDEKLLSAISSENDLNVGDVARIVGCYKALRDQGEKTGGVKLKRAVSFCNTIKNSKTISSMFNDVVKHMDEQQNDGFTCQTAHVDGTDSALVRNQRLSWLREDAGSSEHGEICRILSNAQCLTEGVDVPALDAVMFMNPRKSQVDVVQAVGRVMRKAENKEYGYIILPVVIPPDKTPEEALDDNTAFGVVWDVLRALRSHDDRLDHSINAIDLNEHKPVNIIVNPYGPDGADDSDNTTQDIQLRLQFDAALEGAIYAKIVERVGDRKYWESWAKDVAGIHDLLVRRINGLRKDRAEIDTIFSEFLASLRDDINDSISEDDAVSMLSQHLITRPVFDALFDDYTFSRNNPVAVSMSRVSTALEPFGLINELEKMGRFYQSVQDRAAKLDNDTGRQKVLMELYEKFFKTAFPREAQSLGIAYTPVEIVDFILHSVQHVLKTEFGRTVGDEGVHVIDPFTGTGTFINRLISNPDLIRDDQLAAKYASEIHANEMLLMAYYIGAANIEQAWHARMGGDYRPFTGIVFTDTFQMYERGTGQFDIEDHALPENNERRRAQMAAPITVIVGNPPYSVGQKSQNDDNKNLSYPNLDTNIRETYAARSSVTNKNALYDSYIRAFKWASERIGDEGVIAFVSNAGWLRGASQDGMRKCLLAEFDEIYVFDIKGDARLSGEAWRKQGGKIFGQASRVPVSITLLVKNPVSPKSGVIHYHDIGDYLSRAEKLEKISTAHSIAGLEWRPITPNAEGDWLNQRDPDFQKLLQLGNDEVKRGKVIAPDTVFRVYSGGVKTNRDAWTYNFNRSKVAKNMRAMVAFYNEQVLDFHRVNSRHGPVTVDNFVDNDPTKISWDGTLKDDLKKERNGKFSDQKIVRSIYKPFTLENLYFDRQFNNSVHRMPSIFPSGDTNNRVIAVTGVGASAGFSCLMADLVPCLDFIEKSQCFPRWTYDEDGGNRQDNIPGEAVNRFHLHYRDDGITADRLFDYVYGVLHAPDYRARFANDLNKELPRIPLAPDFWAFADAGAALAHLHLNYMTGPRAEMGLLLDGVAAFPDMIPQDCFTVKKMKWFDRPEGKFIQYSRRLSLGPVPPDALRYVVSGKSALDWIIDRYCVRTDKASGIINDANDWIAEQGSPDALVDLIRRVAWLSVETMKIVDGLPPSLAD